MGSKADYLENKVLQHIFTASYTRVATCYLALFTANPSDSGGGTEVSGGSYARLAVAMDAGNWTLSGNSITNAVQMIFVKATANWGTITGFAIFDASSAGNMMYWGALGSSKAINSGDYAIFDVGDIDITED